MSAGGDERVLHLIWSDWENVPYLVSPENLAAAERATADDAPRPHMNFGEVRRGGDIDELEDLLSWHGDASLEQYIAGIERAAGRPPGSGDLFMRLRALDDFDFAGEDEATGDDVDFREEQIAWDEPVVATGRARKSNGTRPAQRPRHQVLRRPAHHRQPRLRGSVHRLVG